MFHERLTLTDFEPIALNNGVDAAVRAEVEEFHRALSCYRRQDWEAAATFIQGLRTAWPDKKLYKIYAERIAYYRENPPGPEWNGVHVFKTK